MYFYVNLRIPHRQQDSSNDLTHLFPMHLFLFPKNQPSRLYSTNNPRLYHPTIVFVF